MATNKTKNFFSLNLIERILKKKGALRVSKEAKREMSLALKQRAEQIAALAIRNACHFGRKQIMTEDIRYAESKLK